MNTQKEFTKGIITRLKATAGLTAITSTRIFTDVPQKTAFPYAYVSTTMSDYSTKDSATGVSLKLTVQVFSQEPAPDEVMDAQAAIITALDRQEANVTVTGHTLVMLQKGALIDITKEPNGVIWQSVTQFDVLID